MKRQFKIQIDSHDLGQLLDGLHVRSEAWQKTSEYLKSGYASEESFICEECSNANEAAAIASHYLKIIALIERQVDEQGGWR